MLTEQHQVQQDLKESKICHSTYNMTLMVLRWMHVSGRILNNSTNNTLYPIHTHHLRSDELSRADPEAVVTPDSSFSRESLSEQ